VSASTAAALPDERMDEEEAGARDGAREPPALPPSEERCCEEGIFRDEPLLFFTPRGLRGVTGVALRDDERGAWVESGGRSRAKRRARRVRAPARRAAAPSTTRHRVVAVLPARRRCRRCWDREQMGGNLRHTGFRGVPLHIIGGGGMDQIYGIYRPTCSILIRSYQIGWGSQEGVSIFLGQ
jgi:hypothetical protein